MTPKEFAQQLILHGYIKHPKPALDFAIQFEQTARAMLAQADLTRLPQPPGQGLNPAAQQISGEQGLINSVLRNAKKRRK